MDIKQLSNEISVSGQISAEDLATFKSSGFNSIICNRPNGEGDDQVSFDEIAAAASELGLETRYIPMVLDGSAPPPVAEFASAVADLPKPILAYCKSGGRSQHLWRLINDQ